MPASHDRLQAVGEMAATHWQHPVYGGRLVAAAQIAQRYLPTPKPVPLFDFSFDLGTSGSRHR
jgi:hypothetical protein